MDGGIAFVILICIFLLLNGDFDKYIPSEQVKIINKLESENKNLKELRKLKDETIENLQKRLRKNKLDDYIR